MTSHQERELLDDVSILLKSVDGTFDPQRIAPDTHLLSLTLGSLQLLEFLNRLEERFSISIPDEDLVVDRFSTLEKIVAYVAARQAAAGGGR
ncbi:acyl carrier protein [Streptomyces sp. MBT49]|uniref:acyl carrier protein n=1 Tax=Streptomyces TaxID=1883 RepID=UPI0019093521|nr:MULTISPECIES: acyl carrier protein [unclassified Streptomyces]MBK3623425.1 acyl carrier protein [Streptomyces sp. MBT49]MBK3631381.1 acyl carrier protein [Streptomyces sp. MBT97]